MSPPGTWVTSGLQHVPSRHLGHIRATACPLQAPGSHQGYSRSPQGYSTSPPGTCTTASPLRAPGLQHVPSGTCATAHPVRAIAGPLRDTACPVRATAGPLRAPALQQVPSGHLRYSRSPPGTWATAGPPARHLRYSTSLPGT